jgi:hypothetical protein
VHGVRSSRSTARMVSATATLAEIEVAVHLLGQGFGLVLEPAAPAKGPDLRADIAGKSYFIEVRYAAGGR